MSTEEKKLGRPKKENALSGAERAKRFREAKKLAGEKVRFVTETKEFVTKKEYEELKRIEEHRSRALASAHSELKMLTQKIEELENALAGKKIRKKATATA